MCGVGRRCKLLDVLVCVGKRDMERDQGRIWCVYMCVCVCVCVCVCMCVINGMAVTK